MSNEHSYRIESLRDLQGVLGMAGRMASKGLEAGPVELQPWCAL